VGFSSTDPLGFAMTASKLVLFLAPAIVVDSPMPRNDQITRQWHLLRQLEGSLGRSLQELVDNVPDDYRKNARMVRRDLEALEAVGFPLVTERHNGQTRWRLMEGFRAIPALGFSATELMALLLSRNLLKPLDGTEIAESLNSAPSKASAALPPQVVCISVRLCLLCVQMNCCRDP
jgi:predicted DNA-binding transcriptional regulator YafY